MIDFAVFVGGVFYVVRRLAAFLTALCVILIAFAQMFFTVFQQTAYCTTDNPYSGPDKDLNMTIGTPMQTAGSPPPIILHSAVLIFSTKIFLPLS
jgi:hypothetical protein